MANKDRVILGKIGAPHGVRGDVRVKPYTDDPLALGDYGSLTDDKGNSYDVIDIRPSKTVVVVRFKQVTSREAAEALNGVELGVTRDQLPDEVLDEDEFYIEDLIGLTCLDAAGQELGKVIAVHNFGADDIIEVRLSATGKNEMFPFSLQVVPSVDLEAGTLVLVPPGEIFAREGEDE